MTMYANARYATAENDTVMVEINGALSHVPATPENRHWSDMVAAGIHVAPYTAPDLSTHDVNTERDRRLKTFPYGGKLYDFDAASQANIQGALSIAMAAVMAGAQPGNLRWSDPTYDFSWITTTNEVVPMDAHEVVAFGKAAAAWKSAHIFKARTLKDQATIPADYKSDEHWPLG